MPVASTLQLTYRPDLPALIGRWLADSPLPALQAEYAEVLTAIRTHGTTRLLLDIRRRGQPDPAATTWFATEWLPQTAAALPPPLRLRLAYLVSPQRGEFQQANAFQSQQLQHVSDPGRPYELLTFNTEGEALAWLVR